ncbi:MAG: toll/interleukin-1 receptor domain-containing protein, partial [Oscillospiraceae bacterium]|nr:toll/interleukin-1 receptor domain-containing protein [Oscillospiraceae bacterium]
MALFICRMCGGRLTPLDKTSICKCEFCGVVQSVPLLDDEDMAEMCAAAERFRREYRYDKAIELYEELIRHSPADADLYWALALCRCGVEYAERGGEYVPALNRTTARSLLSDEDYKTALKYADAEQRAAMELQAERIDAARRRVVEISRGSEDCDVYLNCRETDENGRRTTDSLIAADIYAKLCAEGLRVFFPRVSLEDKAGSDWEPYIFSALSSAAVMIVVGTSAESFEDIWVRNAWSRFLTFAADDRRRRIIPAFRDMEAKELPRELAGFQALDMSRLGFEVDLAASVGSVLGTRRESRVPTSTDPLLRRARLFIEDRDYSGAEQLIAELPDSAEKYLLKLLSEYKLTSEKELEELKTDFSGSENYRAAMRLGDEGFRLRLREHNLNSVYNKCCESLENAVTDIQYRAAAAEFRVLNYRDSAEKADYAEKKAAEISEENEIKRREGVYSLAAKMLEESRDTTILFSAEKSLRELGDYRNAAELAEKCAAKLAELTANAPAPPPDDKKKLPVKWAAAAGALAVAGIIGITIGVSGRNKTDADKVISDMSEPLREKTAAELNDDKYKRAAALLKQGSYDEAELIFTALGDFSDAAERAKECKYQRAVGMMEQGDLDKAELTFIVLGDYSDSARKLTECRYRAAVALKESGELEAAESAFIKLGEYKDCQEQLSETRYMIASEALSAGDTAKAEQLFLTICGYSDAATQYCKIVYADSERLVGEGDIAGACERLKPLLDCYNNYKLDRDYWFVGKLAEAARSYTNGSYGVCKGTLESSDELNGLPITPALIASAERMRLFTLEKRDVISFGHYPSEPDRSIKWLVISNDGEGTIVLASKYAVFEAPFDTGNADGWENSSIRKRLNNDFLYSAFSADELALIQYTDIAADSYYTNRYPRYNETQYMGTESYADKVYLASY